MGVSGEKQRKSRPTRLRALRLFVKWRPTRLRAARFLKGLSALNGFNLPNIPPKNAATRLQKKTIATKGLLTDDEQEDAMLDIISIGIILAAILTTLYFNLTIFFWVYLF